MNYENIGGHPIIIYYGETTLKGNFPLALVIGREPNDEDGMSNQIGQYYFESSPHCAFWNTSHSMFAKSIDQSTKWLKEQFKINKSSPIVYSDALPTTILNKEKDKNAIRLGILDKDIEQHITNLFSHMEIIKRIKIVFLSGLYDSNLKWKVSKGLIIAKCKTLGIESIEVPFFYPTNSREIIKKVDAEDKMELLIDILQPWRIPVKEG